MTSRPENTYDQLKQGDVGSAATYLEEPTHTRQVQDLPGKGTRTQAFETDPPVFVAITPQQRADAVRALTEMLTQFLHDRSDS